MTKDSNPLKCPDADTYTALLPPKCGCETCVGKWQAAQAARIERANAPDFVVPKRRPAVGGGKP